MFTPSDSATNVVDCDQVLNDFRAAMEVKQTTAARLCEVAVELNKDLCRALHEGRDRILTEQGFVDDLETEIDAFWQEQLPTWTTLVTEAHKEEASVIELLHQVALLEDNLTEDRESRHALAFSAYSAAFEECYRMVDELIAEHRGLLPRIEGLYRLADSQRTGIIEDLRLSAVQPKPSSPLMCLLHQQFGKSSENKTHEHYPLVAMTFLPATEVLR